MSKKIINTEKLSVSTWINGGTAFVNILLKQSKEGKVLKQYGAAVSLKLKKPAFRKRDNDTGFMLWFGPLFLSSDSNF